MAAENTGAVFANTNAPRLDRNVFDSVITSVRSGFGSGPGMESTPLSASLHNYHFGHSHDTSLSSDPSLEPTIRALLDQQAEIEAKLAALLPRKYGPNVRVELDMLRHKLRALRALASDNREFHAISFSVILFFMLILNFSSLLQYRFCAPESLSLCISSVLPGRGPNQCALIPNNHRTIRQNPDAVGNRRC